MSVTKGRDEINRFHGTGSQSDKLKFKMHLLNTIDEDTTLPDSLHRLLSSQFRRHGDYGREMRTSHHTMAIETGKSVSTVQRWLKALETSG